MLWHLTQEIRAPSCLLPSQSARSLPPWHWRHCWSMSADGVRREKVLIFPRSPLLSTCALPGPWQLSHPRVAAGDVTVDARPCALPWYALACSSWHPKHTCSPTYASAAGGTAA